MRTTSRKAIVTDNELMEELDRDEELGPEELAKVGEAVQQVLGDLAEELAHEEELEPQESVKVGEVDNPIGEHSGVGPIKSREGYENLLSYSVVRLNDMGQYFGSPNEKSSQELGALLRRGIYNGVGVQKRPRILDEETRAGLVGPEDLVVSHVNQQLGEVSQCPARLTVFSKSPGLVIFSVTSLPAGDWDEDWTKALRAKVQRAFEKVDLRIFGGTRVVFMGSVLEDQPPPGDPEDFVNKELQEDPE
jgi:hypothetical protein